ncbi:MAG: response regulator [Polyangiaceae bacterium]
MNTQNSDTSSERAVTTREGEPRELGPRISSYRARVVVADDDADIRTLLAVALRREGYEVVEAATGAELLEIVGDWLLFCDGPRPDAVISDIRMPGFSGTTVLGGLRATDKTIPFLLMTAFGSEQLEEYAREMGADGFYRKPFDVFEMVATLSALLSRGRVDPVS